MCRKRYFVKCIVFMLIFGVVFNVCGGIGWAYSLEDLVNMAFESNLDIITGRHGLEEAGLLVGQAEAGRNLRADLVLGTEYQKTTDAMKSLYSMTGEEVGDSWGSFSGTIVLSKAVVPSIENMAGLRQAEKGKEDAAEALRRKEGEVLVDVLDAAYNVFKARNGLTLAEAVLEREKRTLTRVEERLRQGEAVPRDVMEQEVEVAQAEETVMTARYLLSMAEQHLKMVVGSEMFNVDQVVKPAVSVDALPNSPNPWPWDMARMIEIALERRPEINRAKAGMDVASIQLEQAISATKPDISIEGSYSSAQNNITAGLSFDSTYRLSGTLTKFDTNLPEAGAIEISDDNWDRFMDLWEDYWNDDGPDWTPSKGAVEDMFSTDMQGEDEWRIGVQVQFNVFDSNLVNSQIKEKETALTRMDTMYQQVEEGLKLDVTSKYYDLQQAYTSVKNKELAYNFSLRQASDMNAMYEAGLITIAENEMAEIGVKYAENELYSALYGYELAKARLGLALGLEVEWIISVLEVY